MKFTAATEINKPTEEVIKLFYNPDSMIKWMERLQIYEPISGGPSKLLKLVKRPDYRNRF